MRTGTLRSLVLALFAALLLAAPVSAARQPAALSTFTAPSQQCRETICN